MTTKKKVVIGIPLGTKTKAQVKTWAENMTVWDLYLESKTNDQIEVTLYEENEMVNVEKVYKPTTME